MLQTAVEELYPNSTVTTTIDPGFNVLRYAQVAEEPILVREDKSIQSLKKTFFFQPSKRHQGPYAAGREELPHFTTMADGDDDDGFIVEQVVLAGYDVAWRNTEFKLIVATWPEGFYQAVQWHIISDDKQANNQLLAAVSKVARTFEDVIWVFDQGYWQPDRNLWLSVQKVSLGGKSTLTARRRGPTSSSTRSSSTACSTTTALSSSHGTRTSVSGCPGSAGSSSSAHRGTARR